MYNVQRTSACIAGNAHRHALHALQINQCPFKPLLAYHTCDSLGIYRSKGSQWQNCSTSDQVCCCSSEPQSMQFVTVFIARPNTKHMNLMQSLMLAVIRMQMHLVPNHLLSPYACKCTSCQRSCWLLLRAPAGCCSPIPGPCTASWHFSGCTPMHMHIVLGASLHMHKLPALLLAPSPAFLYMRNTSTCIS